MFPLEIYGGPKIDLLTIVCTLLQFIVSTVRLIFLIMAIRVPLLFQRNHLEYLEGKGKDIWS